MSDHAITPDDILVGVLAQLTGASTGVAIGLLVSRPVIRRTGYSLITARDRQMINSKGCLRRVWGGRRPKPP
ncbi:hypothetical protein ABTZ59_20815 [Streptomyces sp. NPDC094034]|uniref:hypothetical protein n=1 Tax=Streptomyces sp. NPDC094034 TaxID=3155309 RepID=UPI0033286257